MCTHMSVIVHSAGTHQHAHKSFFSFFSFLFCGDRIQVYKLHSKHVMDWPISTG